MYKSIELFCLLSMSKMRLYVRLIQNAVSIFNFLCAVGHNGTNQGLQVKKNSKKNCLSIEQQLRVIWPIESDLIKQNQDHLIVFSSCHLLLFFLLIQLNCC